MNQDRFARRNWRAAKSVAGLLALLLALLFSRSVLFAAPANPQPGTVHLSESSRSIYENQTSFQITMSRVGGSDGKLKAWVGVEYETSWNAGDRATLGSDFTLSSGGSPWIEEWSNGQSDTRTLTVTINNDLDAEGVSVVGSELFKLRIYQTSVVANDTPDSIPRTTNGQPAQSVTTIVDDTRFMLASSSLSLTETNASDVTQNLTVQCLEREAATVKVDYKIFKASGNTADEGSDFIAFNSNPLPTLTFGSGVSSQTIAVTAKKDFPNNDAVQETFSVQLVANSTTPHTTLSSPSLATATITDSPGGFRFAASGYSATEPGGISPQVGVERYGGRGGSVSVTIATSNGTAIAGEDYTALAANTTHTFANDVIGTQNRSITILNDSINEDAQAFHVTLSSPTNGSSLGTPQSVDVTIADDTADVPSISISSSFEATEGDGLLWFSATLNGQTQKAVSFSLATANVSAIASEDYTSTSATLPYEDGVFEPVSIPILTDNIDEPDQTFRLNLSGPQNATFASSFYTVTIHDNTDPPVLSVVTNSVLEACGSSCPIQLQLSRQTQKSFSIYYEFRSESGDTATANTDYTAIGPSQAWLSFPLTPSTATTCNALLQVTNDSVREPDETLSLAFGGAGGNITLPSSSAKITIQNTEDTYLTVSSPDFALDDGTLERLRPVPANPYFGPLTYSWSVLDTDGTGAGLAQSSTSNPQLSVGPNTSGMASLRVTVTDPGNHDYQASGDFEVSVTDWTKAEEFGEIRNFSGTHQGSPSVVLAQQLAGIQILGTSENPVVFWGDDSQQVMQSDQAAITRLAQGEVFLTAAEDGGSETFPLSRVLVTYKTADSKVQIRLWNAASGWGAPFAINSTSGFTGVASAARCSGKWYVAVSNPTSSSIRIYPQNGAASFTTLAEGIARTGVLPALAVSHDNRLYMARRQSSNLVIERFITGNNTWSTSSPWPQQKAITTLTPNSVVAVSLKTDAAGTLWCVASESAAKAVFLSPYIYTSGEDTSSCQQPFVAAATALPQTVGAASADFIQPDKMGGMLFAGIDDSHMTLFRAHTVPAAGDSVDIAMDSSAPGDALSARSIPGASDGNAVVRVGPDGKAFIAWQPARSVTPSLYIVGRSFENVALLNDGLAYSVKSRVPLKLSLHNAAGVEFRIDEGDDVLAVYDGENEIALGDWSAIPASGELQVDLIPLAEEDNGLPGNFGKRTVRVRYHNGENTLWDAKDSVVLIHDRELHFGSLEITKGICDSNDPLSCQTVEAGEYLHPTGEGNTLQLGVLITYQPPVEANVGIGQVEWEVKDGVGYVDENAVFHGQRAGVGRIIARRPQDGLADEVFVIVGEAGELSYYEILPKGQTILGLSDKIALKAIGYDFAGNRVDTGTPVWSLLGPGEINQSGVYISPADYTADFVKVQVIDAEQPAVTGSKTLSIDGIAPLVENFNVTAVQSQQVLTGPLTFSWNLAENPRELSLPVSYRLRVDGTEFVASATSSQQTGLTLRWQEAIFLPDGEHVFELLAVDSKANSNEINPPRLVLTLGNGATSPSVNRGIDWLLSHQYRANAHEGHPPSDPAYIGSWYADVPRDLSELAIEAAEAIVTLSNSAPAYAPTREEGRNIYSMDYVSVARAYHDGVTWLSEVAQSGKLTSYETRAMTAIALATTRARARQTEEAVGSLSPQYRNAASIADTWLSQWSARYDAARGGFAAGEESQPTRYETVLALRGIEEARRSDILNGLLNKKEKGSGDELGPLYEFFATNLRQLYQPGGFASIPAKNSAGWTNARDREFPTLGEAAQQENLWISAEAGSTVLRMQRRGMASSLDWLVAENSVGSTSLVKWIREGQAPAPAGLNSEIQFNDAGGFPAVDPAVSETASAAQYLVLSALGKMERRIAARDPWNKIDNDAWPFVASTFGASRYLLSETHQMPDGSWNLRALDTAVAIRALSPELLVRDITLDMRERVFRVNVLNVGLTESVPVRLSLYSEDPSGMTIAARAAKSVGSSSGLRVPVSRTAAAATQFVVTPSSQYIPRTLYIMIDGEVKEAEYVRENNVVKWTLPDLPNLYLQEKSVVGWDPSLSGPPVSTKKWALTGRVWNLGQQPVDLLAESTAQLQITQGHPLTGVSAPVVAQIPLNQVRIPSRQRLPQPGLIESGQYVDIVVDVDENTVRSPGLYEIYLWLDYASGFNGDRGVVIETDESDNISGGKVRFYPPDAPQGFLADLSIDPWITHTPESAGCGDTILVSAFVDNHGGFTASNVVVRMSSQDRLTTHDITIPSIGAGSSVLVSAPFGIADSGSATETIYLEVDPENTVVEDSEINNTQEYTFVHQCGSASGYDVAVTPANISAVSVDGRLHPSVRAINVGDAISQKRLAVSTEANTRANFDYTPGSLTNYGSLGKVISLNKLGWVDYITQPAEDDVQLDEGWTRIRANLLPRETGATEDWDANTGNNVAERTLFTGRTELMVNAVEVLKESDATCARPLAQYNVRVDVANGSGEPGLVRASPVRVILREERTRTVLASWNDVPLDPVVQRPGEPPSGGLSLVAEHVELPAGGFVLKGIIDPENRFIESDEQNNERGLHVLVEEPAGMDRPAPDLALVDDSLQIDTRTGYAVVYGLATLQPTGSCAAAPLDGAVALLTLPDGGTTPVLAGASVNLPRLTEGASAFFSIATEISLNDLNAGVTYDNLRVTLMMPEGIVEDSGNTENNTGVVSTRAPAAPILAAPVVRGTSAFLEWNPGTPQVGQPTVVSYVLSRVRVDGDEHIVEKVVEIPVATPPMYFVAKDLTAGFTWQFEVRARGDNHRLSAPSIQQVDPSEIHRPSIVAFYTGQSVQAVANAGWEDVQVVVNQAVSPDLHYVKQNKVVVLVRDDDPSVETLQLLSNGTLLGSASVGEHPFDPGNYPGTARFYVFENVDLSATSGFFTSQHLLVAYSQFEENGFPPFKVYSNSVSLVYDRLLDLAFAQTPERKPRIEFQALMGSEWRPVGFHQIDVFQEKSLRLKATVGNYHNNQLTPPAFDVLFELGYGNGEKDRRIVRVPSNRWPSNHSPIDLLSTDAGANGQVQPPFLIGKRHDLKSIRVFIDYVPDDVNGVVQELSELNNDFNRPYEPPHTPAGKDFIATLPLANKDGAETSSHEQRGIPYVFSVIARDPYNPGTTHVEVSILRQGVGLTFMGYLPTTPKEEVIGSFDLTPWQRKDWKFPAALESETRPRMGLEKTPNTMGFATIEAFQHSPLQYNRTVFIRASHDVSITMWDPTEGHSNSELLVPAEQLNNDYTITGHYPAQIYYTSDYKVSYKSFWGAFDKSSEDQNFVFRKNRAFQYFSVTTASPEAHVRVYQNSLGVPGAETLPPGTVLHTPPSGSTSEAKYFEFTLKRGQTYFWAPFSTNAEYLAANGLDVPAWDTIYQDPTGVIVKADVPISVASGVNAALPSIGSRADDHNYMIMHPSGVRGTEFFIPPPTASSIYWYNDGHRYANAFYRIVPTADQGPTKVWLDGNPSIMPDYVLEPGQYLEATPLNPFLPTQRASFVNPNSQYVLRLANTDKTHVQRREIAGNDAHLVKTDRPVLATQYYTSAQNWVPAGWMKGEDCLSCHYAGVGPRAISEVPPDLAGKSWPFDPEASMSAGAPGDPEFVSIIPRQAFTVDEIIPVTLPGGRDFVTRNWSKAEPASCEDEQARLEQIWRRDNDGARHYLTLVIGYDGRNDAFNNPGITYLRWGEGQWRPVEEDQQDRTVLRYPITARWSWETFQRPDCWGWGMFSAMRPALKSSSSELLCANPPEALAAAVTPAFDASPIANGGPTVGTRTNQHSFTGWRLASWQQPGWQYSQFAGYRFLTLKLHVTADDEDHPAISQRDIYIRNEKNLPLMVLATGISGDNARGSSYGHVAGYRYVDVEDPYPHQGVDLALSPMSIHVVYGDGRVRPGQPAPFVVEVTNLGSQTCPSGAAKLSVRQQIAGSADASIFANRTINAPIPPGGSVIVGWVGAASSTNAVEDLAYVFTPSDHATGLCATVSYAPASGSASEPTDNNDACMPLQIAKPDLTARFAGIHEGTVAKPAVYQLDPGEVIPFEFDVLATELPTSRGRVTITSIPPPQEKGSGSGIVTTTVPVDFLSENIFYENGRMYYKITVPAPVTHNFSGAYTVKCRVSLEDPSEEGDKSNNEASYVYNVVLPAALNLDLASLTFTPGGATIAKDSTVTVQATLRVRQGTFTGPVPVIFTFGDPLNGGPYQLAATATPNLSAQTLSVSAPITFDALYDGEFAVTANPPGANRIVETTYLDNRVKARINVISGEELDLPDLADHPASNKRFQSRVPAIVYRSTDPALWPSLGSVVKNLRPNEVDDWFKVQIFDNSPDGDFRAVVAEALLRPDNAVDSEWPAWTGAWNTANAALGEHKLWLIIDSPNHVAAISAAGAGGISDSPLWGRALRAGDGLLLSGFSDAEIASGVRAKIYAVTGSDFENAEFIGQYDTQAGYSNRDENNTPLSASDSKPLLLLLETINGSAFPLRSDPLALTLKLTDPSGVGDDFIVFAASVALPSNEKGGWGSKAAFWIADDGSTYFTRRLHLASDFTGSGGDYGPDMSPQQAMNDSTGSADEFDDIVNNRVEKQVTVVEAPSDLSVTVAPASPSFVGGQIARFNVSIHNSGEATKSFFPVTLLIRRPTGEPVELLNDTVVTLLERGATTVASFAWATNGRLGEFEAIASVDMPAPGHIAEADEDANNVSEPADFTVSGDMSFTLVADPAQVSTDSDVELTATVDWGADAWATMDLRVESVADPLQSWAVPISDQVPFLLGDAEDIVGVWNSADHLAGAYRGRAVLKTLPDGDQTFEVYSNEFEILPSRSIIAEVRSLRAEYNCGETVVFEGAVTNVSRNTGLGKVAVTLEVRDAAGVLYWSVPTSIANPIRGHRILLPFKWAAPDVAVADLVVTINAVAEDGITSATDSDEFKVCPSPGVRLAADIRSAQNNSDVLYIQNPQPRLSIAAGGPPELTTDLLVSIGDGTMLFGRGQFAHNQFPNANLAAVSGGVPSGWLAGQGGGQVAPAVVSASAIPSNAAISIQGPSGSWIKTANMPVLGGRPYVLSFWHRGGTGSERLRVMLSEEGEAETPLTGSALTAAAWQRQEITFRPQATTDQIGLRFIVEGGATVGTQIGAFQLEEGSAATAWSENEPVAGPYAPANLLANPSLALDEGRDWSTLSDGLAQDADAEEWNNIPDGWTFTSGGEPTIVSDAQELPVDLTRKGVEGFLAISEQHDYTVRQAIAVRPGSAVTLSVYGRGESGSTVVTRIIAADANGNPAGAPIGDQTHSLAPSWQRFSVTANIPANVARVVVEFETGAANGEPGIAGAQLNYGVSLRPWSGWVPLRQFNPWQVLDGETEELKRVAVRGLDVNNAGSRLPARLLTVDSTGSGHFDNAVFSGNSWSVSRVAWNGAETPVSGAALFDANPMTVVRIPAGSGAIGINWTLIGRPVVADVKLRAAGANGRTVTLEGGWIPGIWTAIASGALAGNEVAFEGIFGGYSAYRLRIATNPSDAVELSALRVVGYELNGSDNAILDFTPPTGDIFTPSANHPVASGFAVGAHASDNVSGVESVTAKLLREDNVLATALLSQKSAEYYEAAFPFEDIADGEIALRIEAVDYAGNSGVIGEHNLLIDNTPPVLTAEHFVDPANANSTRWMRGSDAVLLKVTVDDESLAAADITADLRIFGLSEFTPADSIDGNLVATWDLSDVSLDPPDGWILSEIVATDSAGNRSLPVFAAIQVDSTPPAVQIAPLADLPLRVDHAILDGLSRDKPSELITAIEWRRVRPSPMTTWQPVTVHGTLDEFIESFDLGLSSLVDGYHVYEFRARDAAQNVTDPPAKYSFGVGANGPVIEDVVITDLDLPSTEFITNTHMARVDAYFGEDGLDADSIRADMSDLGYPADMQLPDPVITDRVATWILDGVICSPADGTVGVTVGVRDQMGRTSLATGTILSDNTHPHVEEAIVPPAIVDDMQGGVTFNGAVVDAEPGLFASIQHRLILQGREDSEEHHVEILMPGESSTPIDVSKWSDTIPAAEMAAGTRFAEYQLGYPSLPDGKYVFQIRATDRVKLGIEGANDTDLYEVHFVVDTSAPVIHPSISRSISGPDGPFMAAEYIRNTNDVRVTAIIDEPTLNPESVRANLGAFGGGDPLSESLSPDVANGNVFEWNIHDASGTPADGTIAVSITAADQFERTGEASVTVINDNTPPDITGLDLLDNSYLTTQIVRIAGIARDPEPGRMSHVEYFSPESGNWERLEGGESNGDYRFLALVHVPADGTFTISFRAVDVAGNVENEPYESETVEMNPATRPFLELARVTNETIGISTYIRSGQRALVEGWLASGVTLSNSADIRADLSALGGGANVGAGQANGLIASWTLDPVTANPADGPVTVPVWLAASPSHVIPAQIIADNTAPLTTFNDGETPAYATLLPEIHAKAVDLGSGVLDVALSLDADDFVTLERTYETPVGEPEEGAYLFTYRAGDELAEGPHTLQAFVRDRVLNSSYSAIIEFFLDMTPPVATVELDGTSPTNLQDVPFIGTLRDLNGSGIAGGQWRIDEETEWHDLEDLEGSSIDKTFTVTVPFGNAPGEHTIYVKAIDRAGHESADASAPVVLDFVPPVVVYDAPVPPVCTSSHVTLHWHTTTAEDLATSWTVLNVTRFDGSTTETLAHEGDVVHDEGHYVAVAYGRDLAGNVSPATLEAQTTFTIDRTLPDLILTAYDPDPDNAVDVLLGGTASESELECGIDKLDYRTSPDGEWISLLASWEPPDYEINLASIPEGAAFVEVRAIDHAGNSIARQDTFLIDRTSPTLELSEAAQSLDGLFAYRVSGTAADEASGVALVEWKRPSEQTWHAATYAGGAWHFDATFAVGNVNAFQARATDVAGNVSPAGSRTYYLDDVGPAVVINHPAEGGWYNGAVTLDWSTADEDLATSAGLLAWTALGGEEAAAPVAVHDGDVVTSEGLHVVTAWGTDVLGNVGAEDEVSFGIDLTSPTLELSEAAQSLDGLFAYRVSGTAADEASGVALVEWKRPSEQTWHAATYAGGAWHFDATFAVGSVNAFQARATDVAGNVSPAGSRTYYLDDVGPAVVINHPAEGGWYNGAVTLDWSTADEDLATSAGLLAWTALGGSSSSNDPVSDGAIVSDDGWYFLTVHGTDVLGNVGGNDFVEFGIDAQLPTIDISAPVAVRLPNVPISGEADDGYGSGMQRVELSLNGGAWNTLENISPDSEGIYPSLHEYEGAPTLTHGVDRTISTRARDVAGNVSTPATATVDVDLESPHGTIVLPSTSTISGRAVDVKATASDSFLGVDQSGSTFEFAPDGLGPDRGREELPWNAGESAFKTTIDTWDYIEGQTTLKVRTRDVIANDADNAPNSDNPEALSVMIDNDYPPQAPTGLDGGYSSYTEIELTWNKNPEPDFKEYKMYRRVYSAAVTTDMTSGDRIHASDTIANAGSDSWNSFEDVVCTGSCTPPNSNTAAGHWEYALKAVDRASNESGFSQRLRVLAPEAPSDLKATGRSGQVELHWRAVREGFVTGYNVYRRTMPSGSFSSVHFVTGRANVEWTDGTVANGTIYEYFVRAVDGALNESGDSNVAEAQPAAGTGATIREGRFVVWEDRHSNGANDLDYNDVGGVVTSVIYLNQSNQVTALDITVKGRVHSVSGDHSHIYVGIRGLVGSASYTTTYQAGQTYQGHSPVANSAADLAPASGTYTWGSGNHLKIFDDPSGRGSTGGPDGYVRDWGQVSLSFALSEPQNNPLSGFDRIPFDMYILNVSSDPDAKVFIYEPETDEHSDNLFPVPVSTGDANRPQPFPNMVGVHISGGLSIPDIHWRMAKDKKMESAYTEFGEYMRTQRSLDQHNADWFKNGVGTHLLDMPP